MLATREENIKVRKAQLLFRVSEKCGVESYKQVLHSHITLMLTGQELLPLPKAEHTTYTAGQIGEMLGISANMVGKLANRYGLKTAEFGETVWDKSPYSAHQCQTFRYYISVVPVLQKLIEEVADMIEIKYIKGLEAPYLCYDFDKNRYHLDLPIEYFYDEERLNDIVQRASAEVAEREKAKKLA